MLLITTSPDHAERHAYVGINRGEMALELFAQGFFEGGIQLLEDAVENRGPIDLTIYPAIYLIRHGTELMLKHIKGALDSLSGRTPEESSHHRVLELWDTVKEDLALFLSSAEQREHDFGLGRLFRPGGVRELLVEFHNLDRDGDAWRYPTALDGSTHLESIQYVHLRNALEVSRRLWLTLRAWGAWLTDAVSEQQLRRTLIGDEKNPAVKRER